MDISAGCPRRSKVTNIQWTLTKKKRKNWDGESYEILSSMKTIHENTKLDKGLA